MTQDPSLAWVPLDSLQPWDRNPNGHPPRQLEELEAAIRLRGFLSPLLVAEIGDEGVREIRAGHGRALAMRRLLTSSPDFVPSNAPPGALPGQVPAMVVRFATRADADRAGVADNRIAELAEPDDALISAMLREWSEAGDPLEGLGFDDADLAAILGEPSAVKPNRRTRDRGIDGTKPAVMVLSLLVPDEADVMDRAFERASALHPALSRGQLLVLMLSEWLGDDRGVSP